MCMHVRMQIKLCAKCKKEIQLRADIIPKKENMDFFFFLILTVSCLYFGFFLYFYYLFFYFFFFSFSFFFLFSFIPSHSLYHLRSQHSGHCTPSLALPRFSFTRSFPCFARTRIFYISDCPGCSAHSPRKNTLRSTHRQQFQPLRHPRATLLEHIFLARQACLSMGLPLERILNCKPMASITLSRITILPAPTQLQWHLPHKTDQLLFNP